MISGFGRHLGLAGWLAGWLACVAQMASISWEIFLASGNWYKLQTKGLVFIHDMEKLLL